MRSDGSSNAIDDLGFLDDTLIYYIIGDNGASAEGTLHGCFNEMTTLNGMPGIETTEFLLSKIDEFGRPEAYNHYAVGPTPVRRHRGSRRP
jgi:arylsulfatase A-like enzyme